MSASRRSSSAETAVAGRDADARRHGQAILLGPVELERLLERFEQAFGDHLRAGVERHPFGDDDELVAAEAPERVDVAHDAIQARGDRPQQLVADTVAERVVDAT